MLLYFPQINTFFPYNLMVFHWSKDKFEKLQIFQTLNFRLWFLKNKYSSESKIIFMLSLFL